MTTTSQEMRRVIKAFNQGRRRSKYGNHRVTSHGHLFDSKLEARRYGELKLLANAKQIFELEVHVPVYLHANGQRIGYYEADFRYFEGGHVVLEDCKGVSTALYRWKKRHVRAEYGIEIREIKHRR